MVDQHDNQFPDYDRPPLVETVLGVQFDRLRRATNAHWGAFWKTLNPAIWQQVADAPLLSEQFERFERFEEARDWAEAVQLQFSQVPAGRLQVRNVDGNRMVQIQNGRLHFNWLGSEDEDYPRYEQVREEFEAILIAFAEFVKINDLGDFRPNQWEVTYVNQIPQHTVWESPADWGFFRPLGPMPSIESIIDAESFSGEWHFVIPERRGRLHVQWRHAKPSANQGDAELIRLTLTARGGLEPDREESVLEGLDLGRATIVRSFRDLMNREANQYWGLKS